MILNSLKKFDDISCYTYPFPTGRLYIFGNKESLKLIAFGHCINHKKEIEKRFKASVTDEIEKAIEFLDRYLIGEKGEVPNLDLGSFTDKEKKVYNELMKVKFGKTISYKELSEKAGIKNGARFVGSTMARNYFPIFIPCHRVVNASGVIGNFSAGRAVKSYLLQHEKVLSK
ncbi:MAG: methylated-DNA--[protein]-cysteine S-methyltransferase [Spirochaetes bacterium]|nr:methylated-DNA--[protein]-cysteine S-methyltransferase [Spirochaetota bacterium]